MSKSSKSNLLLVWWYDRKDLIAPYLEMQEDFNITVLFYRFPEQENKAVAETLPFRRIYWTDYSGPYKILEDVKPDQVIFFGFRGIFALGLMIAAKFYGITYYYVSHGLVSRLQYDPKRESEVIQDQIDTRYQKNSIEYRKKKWHSWLFLFNIIKLSNIKAVVPCVILLWYKILKANDFKGTQKVPLKYWEPTSFIFYAPHYSSFVRSFLKVKEDKMLYIGPYLMDTVFRQIDTLQKSRKPSLSYWLFVDQPISTIPQSRRHELINRLAEIAMKRGRTLVLKLHPMDYDKGFEWHVNVTVERHVDNLGALIFDAELCFGFYSALLLAVIPFKNTILFKHQNLALIDDWESTGSVKALDFDFFDDQEILDDFNTVDQSAKQKFINDFVHKVDGKGVYRLRQILLNRNTN